MKPELCCLLRLEVSTFGNLKVGETPTVVDRPEIRVEFAVNLITSAFALDRWTEQKETNN